MINIIFPVLFIALMIANLVVFLHEFPKPISKRKCSILLVTYLANTAFLAVPGWLAVGGSLSYLAFSICSINSAICIILAPNIVLKHLEDNPKIVV